MPLDSPRKRHNIIGVKHAALLSCVLAAIAVAPSMSRAEGNEFFSCVDGDGRVTITNRHYDERSYTCTPFAKLNRSFEAEARKERPSPARAQPPAGKERDETAAALEAARVSAESARTAMEAAQTAAQAARYTAEAAAAFAPPFQIIREW